MLQKSSSKSDSPSAVKIVDALYGTRGLERWAIRSCPIPNILYICLGFHDLAAVNTKDCTFWSTTPLTQCYMPLVLHWKLSSSSLAEIMGKSKVIGEEITNLRWRTLHKKKITST
jgi:hypothetical protein